MSTTPKTSHTTKVTRRYTFDPTAKPIKHTPRYGKDEIYVTSVVITRTNDQGPNAEVSGVAAKKDGTPGRAERNGGTYYSAKDAPRWIAHLMEQMPTPRVTLIPPTGKDKP